MFSNKIKVGIFVSLMPVASMAQDSNPSVSTYYELHNPSSASSAYQSFKEGSGDDPFKLLDSGYRGRYSYDLSKNVVGEKQEMVDSFLESNESDILGMTKSRLENEKGALSSMYERHFDAEGNFDAESYADAYQSHMDSKRLSREEDIDRRSDALVETMSQGLDLQRGYRDSLINDVSTAQDNLVSIISSESQEKKTALDEIRTNALSRQSDKDDLLNDTLALANQYTDCGAACDFPPPVEDETICYSDGTNYVENTVSDFYKHGELMRNSSITVYIVNGREIYSREVFSFYHAGEISEPQIIESGSKDGFSKGTLTNVTSAGSGSSQSRLIRTYEICQD